MKKHIGILGSPLSYEEFCQTEEVAYDRSSLNYYKKYLNLFEDGEFFKGEKDMLIDMAEKSLQSEIETIVINSITP